MEEQARAFVSDHLDHKGNGNGSGRGDLAFNALSPIEPAVANAGSPPSAIQTVFEPVLDSEEAAALLHIHPKTLQRLARNGEIPGFRIGKLWGFRASTLNSWLESRASIPSPMAST